MIEFFTNASAEAKGDAVVQAPAFSITKVLAVATPLVTSLATWLASRFKEVSFSSGELTVLIVAVIAFVAITASADARSIPCRSRYGSSTPLGR